MPIQHAAARSALLLLADGRFPAGGYANSGGLEPTVESGALRTVADLAGFLSGRLRTSGLVTAAFAAATCREMLATTAADPAKLLELLDQELDARMPSPAQRNTSRRLGRQLVRAVNAIMPETDLDPLGRAPHHPMALGAAHAACGLTPHDAALACLHEAAAGPASAAVRLLSIDPFAAHAVLARLGPLIDDLAAEAVARAAHPDDLPADAGPLLDTNAERHDARLTRLFAS